MIAAEDRTFETNKGIDPKGILRAAFSNARGDSTQGASTITQQYVKVFYLSQERTLTRKVKEAFVSLKIQRQQSKDEILQGYLNTIYFGRGAYGIQAAAQAYFDKDAKDLTVQEGAVLASVLNSPTALDPANGAGQPRSGCSAATSTSSTAWPRMGNLAGRARPTRSSRGCRGSPRSRPEDQYGGQRGHMLALVQEGAARATASPTRRSPAAGCKVTTTFTRNAMRAAEQAVAAQRPKGLKEPARRGRRRSTRPPVPLQGDVRRPGLPQEPDQLGARAAARRARPSSRSRWPPASRTATPSRARSRATRRTSSPTAGTRSSTRARATATTTAPRSPLTTATEQSVNTAYVDLTESMDNGPAEDPGHRRQDGHPAQRARARAGLAGISLGSATISPVDMANSYGTIADGGTGQEVVRHQQGHAPPTGEVRYKAPHEGRPGRCPTTSTAT